MFQIHLNHSHYDQIVVAAANTADRASVNGTNSPDPIWLETGWATRFDGGGNTHTPSDFVALYGEASSRGMDDGRKPVLFALVVCDGWQQDRFRGDRTFLHHRRFSSGDVDGLTNDGLDEIQAAYERSEEWEVVDETYVPEHARKVWEVVAEADVPEHARTVMEKSIATVRGLFGQGGDFFGV